MTEHDKTTPLFLFSENQLIERKQRLLRENAANLETVKRIDALLAQSKYRKRARK